MLDVKKQNMTREELNDLSKEVVDVIYTVHEIMGPGLLESVYVLCAMKEFELRNIKARCEVAVPLVYKGYELTKEFRIDILVSEEIILEFKSTELMHSVFEAQLISYLKLADKKLGFLVNFNVTLIKEGIKRFVNNF